MANGYIGKISAVVTANTSDLSRKLSGAVGDVDKFANRVASSIERSSQNAQDSLSKIFTPLQRLQRNIQAGLAGNVFRRDNVEQYIRSVQQAVSISEQLGKPLTAGATQFQKLTLEVQGAFLPALDRAQTAVISLSTTLQQQGSVSERSFGQVEAVVNSTTKAIQRLTQAQQLASQSFTGNELQFGNPRLFETLSANARTTQRAAALPASALVDGDIARQIRALEQYQNAAVEAAARVESLRLEPNVRPEVLIAAERRFENIIETARRAGREVETSVANAQGLFTVTNARPESAGLGLFGTQAGTAEQRALAKARELSAEFAKLPESAQRGLSGLSGIAANIANRVDQGKASAEQLEAVLEKLATGVASARPATPATPGTGLIVRPPDADVKIAATQGSLLDDFAKQQTDRQVAIRQSLGRGLDDPIRALSGVQSSITGLKSSLDSLPLSVRSQFIPAIKAAENEFERLSLSPGRTAQQVDALSDRLRTLRANASAATAAADFGRSFGGQGVQGLNLGIDSRVLRGVGAEIEFVQSSLSNLGAEARGPVLVALERLRQAATSLFSGGAIDTSRGRRELELLRQELVRTLSEAGGGKQNVLADQLKRVGDVGRGGFDKYSLAVQQAAFAVDDFLSVQGDLSQRIRAVQNNVTQLAFILGGTKGLFIGLGAAIAAQAVIGLINFANGGKTAEDQAKALNDALARQKSLVDDLRQAFESLGDAIARQAFSSPAQKAREFSRELGEIARKQKELRESRVAELDAGVQGERGFQASISRRLEGETDAGSRVVLQRSLRDSRRRERESLARATSESPSGDQVAAAIAESVLSRSDFRENRAGARAAAGAVDRGAGADAIANQRAAIRRELESLQSSFQIQVGRQDAVNAAADLQRLLNALELPLTAALDDLSNQISRASLAAAIEIEAAQGDVADAIRRGVRGAAAFQAGLDNTARQLAEAQDQVRAAQQIEDPDRREVEVRRAEGRVRDIGLRLDAINEAAREVRLGRGFGGERTTAALSGLGDARFINEEAGLRARLRAAIDAEEQARRSVEAAIQRGDEAARQRAIEDLEAAQAVSDLAAAAAEAAIALEQAFARIRQTAENIASQSEGIANDAQRRLDEQDPRAPGAVNRDELRRDRDDAERQLIQDRRRERELQNRLDRERAEAANDPAVAAIDRQLEQLRSDREEAAADARLNGNFEDPRAAERRENEIARLEAERDDRVRQQTAGTQALIDKENELIAARRRAIEEVQRQRDFEAEVARRRKPEGDAIRGLDLLERPGQRAGRELRQSIADIESAFDRTVESILDRAGGRPQDARAELDKARADRDAAVERARQDAFRAQAPAIFGLADAVQNAILQGPSRAALEATDVSTVEGARELNRLLRGDDAARNQDLVQLQREANRLLEVIAEGQAGVAN